MEFYIKQNSTLPILKMEVIKDGRSDYNLNSFLSASTTFLISLYDKSNDTFLFASKECYVTTEYSEFEGKDLYYLNYQFTSKDTLREGRYEVQISVPSEQGVILLPLQEKYYVNVVNSFAAKDLTFNTKYIASLPCCGPKININYATIDLSSYYNPGSLIVLYTLVSNKIFNFDVNATFTDVLGVYTGLPVTITTGVTITAGNISGSTYLIFNDVDFNNLDRTNSFKNVIIDPKNVEYDISLNSNSIFPTPPPSPSNTPTPTITPTQTKTQTPTSTQTPTPTNPCVQYLTDEFGNFLLTESGDYIISELNPCITPTPTPTPTNPCVQYLTDEFGNFLLTESGDYIISEINTCVTPTPTVTPTQTKTPSATPTNTPTPSPFYYYYNLLDCDNSNNKVGRSITGGLTGIYNVDVDKCYSIVGILFGPSYDYDLDLLTLVTNCNDILCTQPTPTPTPTPSSTPIICDTFTFTGNNVTTTVNSATKTSSGGWDGDAYSVESYTTPVSVSFQVSNNNAYLMGGFSYNPNATPGNTYVDITYGLYIQPNFLEIYEYGNQVTVPGSMTNTTSDIWKVDYNGTDVKYYKNDVLIYTSSNAVTQPLHIYFPILTQGDGVTNVCIITSPLPSPTPTNTPTITPSPTTEPLYPLTLYVQPLSGGQAIIFDGVTYTAETTVNIQLNTFYNIEAVPTPGYLFTGWNIYGGSFSSTGQSTTVAISLTSAANLAPSYSVDPNYDALEGQLSTNLLNYQNAIDNDWVSITQEEYNNIFNNVDAVIKIGNSDEQVNTRDTATGWDTTTFGTIDANTPLTIPTGYYVVGFVAESWNQNGQVELGYTTTYHTGAPTYMGNSPNVIGGMTMFYVRKRPGNVEGAPASTNLYPVLNFISPAYPNAVLNTFGWYTLNSGATWVETVSAFQTAKIQILLTNTRSWPLPPLPSPTPTSTPTPTPTQTPSPTCYTVRQYLYGYDPSSGNGGLYVLDADYPNVGDIPAGATATINGTSVTVTYNTPDNSPYFQGNPGHYIDFNPSAGNIPAGTFIEFCWFA